MATGSVAQDGELARRIGATALFGGMAPDHLASLAAHTSTRAMQAGELLFHRGDPGTHMLVILTGQVRIALPGVDGRDQVLRVLHPGGVLGELALLDGRGRSANAVAETNGLLLVLERQHILEAMRANPDLALAMLTILADRLRAISWLLESMVFHDAGGRLATILLTLGHGQAGRHFDITQGALGERVAATRETVNRKLKEWEAEGAIALLPGRITLLDPAVLRRHAPPSATPDDGIPDIW